MRARGSSALEAKKKGCAVITGYVGIGYRKRIVGVLEYYSSFMKDPDCKGSGEERVSGCLWLLAVLSLVRHEERLACFFFFGMRLVRGNGFFFDRVLRRVSCSSY